MIAEKSQLQIDAWLKDPDSVFIYQEQVPDKPAPEDFSRAAQKALEWMHLELNGQKVVIKPNVTSGEHFADPDTGITTHPGFVGGLAEYFYRHHARPGGVYIVEDPRDTDDYNPRHWKGTGYLEMAQASGAKIRCPHSKYCVKKPVPEFMVHPFRNVTRYAVDPQSVLINVPKMKTHNLGITSLCLKNLMGLDDVFDRHYCGQAWNDLPADRMHADRPKSEWMDEELHEQWQTGLAKRLADLAKVIKPDLNIVEGVVGRDGTGFNRGRNYPLGMVIAGINPVAVDSVTSFIMGFDPSELIYLRVAQAAGLGQNDLTRLHLFTVEDDKITPCDHIEHLQVEEPFRVIRDIIGES